VHVVNAIAVVPRDNQDTLECAHRAGKALGTVIDGIGAG
jgi:hypothetical protein